MLALIIFLTVQPAHNGQPTTKQRDIHFRVQGHPVIAMERFVTNDAHQLYVSDQLYLLIDLP